MIRFFNCMRNMLQEPGSMGKVAFYAIFASLYFFFGNIYNGGYITQNSSNQPVINFWQLILVLIISFITSGYFYEIVKNRMNDGEKLLPEVDLVKALVNGFRVIPFCIVWGVYSVLFIVIFSLLFGGIFRGGNMLNPVISVIMVVIFALINLFLFSGLFILLCLHVASSFKYKHVLNLINLFTSISLAGLPITGLLFMNMLSILLIVIPLFVSSIFGNVVSGIILMLLIYFVFTILVFVFTIRICETILEKLDGTALLTDCLEG